MEQYTNDIEWTPERGLQYGQYENCHFYFTFNLAKQMVVVSGFEEAPGTKHGVINEFQEECVTILACMRYINEYIHATKQPKVNETFHNGQLMRVVNNGYRMRDIKKMHSNHFVDSLNKWLHGQTTQREEGTNDTLVFVWDYEEFVKEYVKGNMSQ